MNMRSFFFGKEKFNELYQTKRVVVYSPVRGSGVSFISELIVFGLSKIASTCLVELGSPKFYDSLGFEKKFLASGYIDFFEKVRAKQNISFEKKNMYKGVSWIAKKSLDTDILSSAELFRLFIAPKEEYCIFDCSGIDQDTALDLLAEADYPIIVLDPLPSKLVLSRSFLEKLKISLPNAILIINQMNEGVYVSELVHFLSTKSFFSVSSVPQEYIYKAEYASVPISTLPELHQNLAKTQDMLSKIFQ